MGMGAQPISPAERMDFMDIFRGLAVFGIFFVNILYMSTPDLFYQRGGALPEESALDQGIRLAIDMFLAGKCYPILSFLFGLGFFLFMRRSEQKGERAYRLFSRRMLILFLLGIVHMAFFYNGDVLHNYALIGCLLMLFYRRKDKTVLVWALSILVVYLAMFSLAFLQPEETLKAGMLTNAKIAQEEAAAAIEVNRDGDYGQWLSFHLREEVLPNLQGEQIGYPSMFAMMLLGFYCGRIGVFENIGKYARFIRRIRTISGTASLLTAILLGCTRLGYIESGAYQGQLGQFLIYGCGLFLSFLYLSVLTLLMTKPGFVNLLQPLKFAGRMSLTNYLLQSVVSIGFFTGLGLYATLNFLEIVGYCLIVIAVEIGFSLWWMNRMPLGPMEWVWRRFTYGKLHRARKGGSVSA
ncbi:DUF418 domain-containing protein [Cohnella xylanilytica]|nr:DUF418 domain-containing protein [Cohnella xylanilytica]